MKLSSATGAVAWLGAMFVLGPSATPYGNGDKASGGGTYFPEPGILSEFAFSSAAAQCKIGHAVLPGGITLQMLMMSTTVDSVVIDTSAGTADLYGSMDSNTRLTLPDGTYISLLETVPYHAHAADNGEPGAGVDTFSLSVTFTDTPGFDQHDVFGPNPTFGGTLATGNVNVH